MDQPVYGKISGVPTDIEPAIRVADFKFFECPWQGRTLVDKSINGPFGLRVTENQEEQSVKMHWLSAPLTKFVRFIADDSGVAVCWLVDDRWWHNRLYLMDSPQVFRVINYHTRQGTFPASYVQTEIDALKAELMGPVEIFRVLRDGRDYDSFPTKALAQKFIDGRAKVVTKFVQGGVVNESTFEHDYSIVPGTKIVYKPEVARLTQEFKNLKFGWTSCPKFMEEIKPRVEERIAEIRKSQPQQPVATGVTKADLMGVLRQLTDDERAEIMGLAASTSEVAITPPADESDEVVHAAPEIEDEQPVLPKTEEAPAKKRVGRPRKVSA